VVVFVCIKYLPVNTVPRGERFLLRRIGPAEMHLYRCVARYGYKDLHKRDDRFEESLLENLVRYIRYNASSEGSTISEGAEAAAPSPSPSPSPSQVSSSRESPGRVGQLADGNERGSPSHVGDGDSIELEGSGDGSMRMGSSSSLQLLQKRGAMERHVRFAPVLQHDADSDADSESAEESEEDLAFLDEARRAGVVHILGDVVVRARRDSNALKRFAVDYVYASLRRICRESSVILNIPHESLFNVGQVYHI
jgi:KUP system potassium uptake protein